MARIEHVALWCRDLERVRAFYEKHFGATAGPRYRNLSRGFESYFLSFEGGARLELMTLASGLEESAAAAAVGYAHLAFALGTEARVDAVTESLRDAGCVVLDGPRRTGDGYYESVVLDPEGNRVELTA